MISLSLSFILFTLSISLMILLAMKLIFVTKTELQNKFNEFKLDILKSIDARMVKFTEEIQKFIDIAMEERITNISKQNIDIQTGMTEIMGKLTKIEEEIKKPDNIRT